MSTLPEKDLVEAIARAIHEVDTAHISGAATSWDAIDEAHRMRYRIRARAALQAIQAAGYEIRKRDDILEVIRRAQEPLRRHFEGGKDT